MPLPYPTTASSSNRPINKLTVPAATDLIVPEGIELVVLPPYSPELQPAECLWPLLREAVANDHIDDLASLDHVLGDRCNALTDDPDTIRGRTLFHWWPAFA